MTPQIRELIIAYAVTAVAMLIGLLIMRAQPRAYWRWPVYSVMAMVLGVVKWNLLRKYVLPAEWVFTHANVLYYGALAVYALVGIAFGLLLGRLTRKDGAGPGNRDNSEDRGLAVIDAESPETPVPERSTKP